MFVDLVRVRRGEDPEESLKEPVYEQIAIPETFGPVTFEVSDRALKEFAFSQDDYSHFAVREGTASREPHCDAATAPAGILLNPLLQLFTLRYAPSRVVGLHVEEEVAFSSPPLLGENVALRGTYTDRFVRRGQGCVVMEAEARGEDGRLLLRHRGVEIMRTVPGEVAGRGSAHAASERRTVRTDVRHDLPSIERLTEAAPEVGRALVPLRKVPSQAQMAVFSRIGDWVRNIHNDLDKARGGGLAVPIVQGQQLFCYAVELMTRVFGASWATSGQLAMKFLKPIEAYEAVEVGGAVRRVTDGKVDLDVFVVKEDGDLAAVGWAGCASSPGRSG